MTTIATPKKPKQPKAPKVVRESVIKYNLRYFFTDPEKLELGKRLGEKTNQICQLDDEKSRATKDYGARIKTVENEVAGLSQRVREGYEFRDTECRVLFDTPEPGKKTVIRLDTKQQVSIDQMTTEEKQTSFAENERTFADANNARKGGKAGQVPATGLLAQAYDVIRSTKKASTSAIQRRLKIGYNQASDLLAELEKRGIVGPENGSSPREILVDVATYVLFDEPKTAAGKPGVVTVPADGTPTEEV